jgi:hypothetical protein
MRSGRDWSVLWYAAVLIAAVAWGYAPLSGTSIVSAGPAARSDERAGAPPDRLELRRVAQHMILR